MLMREKINQEIQIALQKLGISVTDREINKTQVEYPDPRLGDYSSNAALVVSKPAGMPPKELAEKIVAQIDKQLFEKVEVAGPGFINFKLKIGNLLEGTQREGNRELQNFPSGSSLPSSPSDKILLEYFQPNIAKPLHIGHMQNAIIGDSIKRMLLHLGAHVESDTHMGDWGTQFGYLIYAYKKYGNHAQIAKNPITELNTLYIKVNEEAATDKAIHEAAKQEFVKLEKGDEESRKIWKQFVDWSMEKFLRINNLMDILPFDHHWPESFYEDKMPAIVDRMKQKNLLKQSQGAWIVDLESQKLGVAIIIKSDGATTYLLRDLATFIFVRGLGYNKHLYVVDNRQSLHYRQLFAILELMGEKEDDEGLHIDYGFMSFKGTALSTRKGNMVLLEDALTQAEEKVAKIIQEKNPALKNKQEAIRAVSIAALKFFILSHNRHSDIEFDWEAALDFEGKSGPYLQYSYARLASILRLRQAQQSMLPERRGAEPKVITPTERRILFLLSIFDEKVQDSLKDFLPNIFADYLYDLASHLNRFYHESPVLAEQDTDKKAFRLSLILKAQETLAKGLDLMGIRPLEEM